jgi:hypothetical protein
MTTLTPNTTYQGWANYETWNVSLWINNDEGLYNLACDCVNNGETYGDFVKYLKECDITSTPDGVDYEYTYLDGIELNEMMSELVD